MNNSAAKVGEIFREAGTAFTKLSEMTLMLQPTDDAPPGSKWSEEEVEMLRGCVNRFAVELNKISQHIKTRTMYVVTGGPSAVPADYDEHFNAAFLQLHAFPQPFIQPQGFIHKRCCGAFVTSHEQH